MDLSLGHIDEKVLPSTDTAGDTPLNEWESAEIHRSALEAQFTDYGSLELAEDNAARYLAPPGHGVPLGIRVSPAW